MLVSNHSLLLLLVHLLVNHQLHGAARCLRSAEQIRASDVVSGAMAAHASAMGSHQVISTAISHRETAIRAREDRCGEQLCEERSAVG